MVLRSPIANDCIKLSKDGQSGPHLFPKLLVKVSSRKINNSMVIPLEEGLLKVARDA